jgi:hypothetical protein
VAGAGAEPGAPRVQAAELAERLEKLEARALRDRDLAAQVAVFDALLRERMLRSDSSAARLLARYQRVLEQIGRQGES